MPSSVTSTARRLTITGVVQGVGFRPHVHRLATFLDLVGHVGNDAGSVFVHVEGAPAAVEEFSRRLVDEAPPLAEILEVTAEVVEVVGKAGFRIVESTSTSAPVPSAPPDTATCPQCRAELADPDDRRHRHPFITCTDCGPRFTIITAMPYDRPSTTMAQFPLCAECHVEYHDPTDRRFHAQPVACHACGPVLGFGHPGDRRSLVRGRTGSDAAIVAAQTALRAGRIVAVKGIGGYHLACLADDDAAIARLRERKHRPGKPFALLVADVEAARHIAHVDDVEATILAGRVAPIVLLRRRGDAPIADNVAPGNPLVGIMVASNPVHQLLLSDVPGAEVTAPVCLVLTSGNLSEEPLCTDDDDARARLAQIADDFLWHDRPIAVPCDDSVVRVLEDGPIMVRRSRGYVPGAVALPVHGRPALALGAELKATVCLSDGHRAWLSQHLGDMGSLSTLRAFEATLGRTEALHGLRPDVLVVDAHPDHTTHRWAQDNAEDREVLAVHHHHAHVASVMAEHGLVGPVLGVAFDGTGYGPDGTIWGGEFLHADLFGATRVAHLASILLPGGDAAVRHPRRVALSHLHAAGIPWDADLPPVLVTTDEERRVLAAQFAKGIATVPTTSMGRFFDAVSSLLGIRHDITFEAQAAIELEILATHHQEAGLEAASLVLTATRREPGGPLVLDAPRLVTELVAQRRGGAVIGALALGFHRAVAEAVVAVAEDQRAAHGLETVCLTGGVFGNALLMRLTMHGLSGAGFDVRRHHVVPPNDGGISLGQVAIAVARRG